MGITLHRRVNNVHGVYWDIRDSVRNTPAAILPSWPQAFEIDHADLNNHIQISTHGCSHVTKGIQAPVAVSGDPGFSIDA